MILTGIADEASADIEGQVKTHRELGWNHIELRLVDGRNVAGELSDRDFDRVMNDRSDEIHEGLASDSSGARHGARIESFGNGYILSRPQPFVSANDDKLSCFNRSFDFNESAVRRPHFHGNRANFAGVSQRSGCGFIIDGIVDVRDRGVDNKHHRPWRHHRPLSWHRPRHLMVIPNRFE